jgi:hypothetical protein
VSTANWGYALLGVVLLAGCASRPANIYSWGSYEDGIYASYVGRNDFPVEKQISELEEAHEVSRVANATLFDSEATGLPYGPYNAKYEKQL